MDPIVYQYLVNATGRIDEIYEIFLQYQGLEDRLSADVEKVGSILRTDTILSVIVLAFVVIFALLSSSDVDFRVVREYATRILLRR